MGLNEDRPIVSSSLLASAARTATTHSGYVDLSSRPYRGVRVFINATAIAATPSVVFSIEARDPLDHAIFTSILDSAAVTAVGSAVLTVYPGGEATNKRAGCHIGHGFRVTATHADSDSITYTVSYELLP